ncbi:MAG: glutathione-disulfide reductase [Hyphomicrobiaceae bacterium]|nr:glutathione-disulfide reductase [Hyphomicrobiaceae bacterium]
MTESYDYDLFVIGGGSGGVRAARMSAIHGAKVAIAEEYRYGGTCVIRGCVPKKLFVYASHVSGDVEDAVGFGWSVEGLSFDWSTLVANKDKEIKRLEGLYAENLEKAGVETLHERAEFVDAHTIRLAGSGKTVTARNILVATGGRPFVPDIPGAEHVITSNEAFHLETLPKRIVIVGAGYIALEFACIFNGLGVDVQVVYRGDQVLRGFDDDLRDGLAEAMRERGIDIRLKTDITGIAEKDGSYEVGLSSGETVGADLVMYATGRVPNTDGLGLENTGVEMGSKGDIVVDEFGRTSIENIFAVGDVTHRVQLTPVAIREGAAFAETVFNDNATKVDYSCIPTAVFTDPEIGTVGMTEDQARQAHKEIDIYKSRFRPLKHTLSGRNEQMIIKLIVDGETDRVIGCHMLGSDAGEIAQAVAIAMRMGATKADFDATVALHPSSAEELVTMREKWQPTAAE